MPYALSHRILLFFVVLFLPDCEFFKEGDVFIVTIIVFTRLWLFCLVQNACSTNV